MKNSAIILLFLHFALFGFSQDISYEVRGVYTKPIVKEKLNQAETLNDINPGYPSSWISQHHSVAVTATCDGKVMKAVGTDNKLNEAQRSMLSEADIGSDIVVDVEYSPKNVSKADSGTRTIHFSFTIIPEVEAEYPGGYQLLKQYLKENAIDKISKMVTEQIELATVRFVIDEKGEISHPQISKTSEDDGIDELLLEVIHNMPKWNPAQNANGSNVKQEFELRVGNIGC